MSCCIVALVVVLYLYVYSPELLTQILFLCLILLLLSCVLSDATTFVRMLPPVTRLQKWEFSSPYMEQFTVVLSHFQDRGLKNPS